MLILQGNRHYAIAINKAGLIFQNIFIIFFKIRVKSVFVQENVNLSLGLTDRLQLMEKKVSCLVKIKRELTSQLRERNQQINLLETKVNSLEDDSVVTEDNTSSKYKRKSGKDQIYAKSFLTNIKRQVLKNPKKAISMPEKLDSISINARKSPKVSLVKAIKEKAKQLGSKNRHMIADIESPIKEVEDNESFVSKW